MTDQELRIADEWDFIVDILRNGKPSLSKEDLCTIIEGINRSYSWAEKWTVPRAGLIKPSTPGVIEQLTKALHDIAKLQFDVTEKELAIHRSTFFRQHFPLGKFSFDFIGREDELTHIHNRLSTGNHQLCLTTQHLAGFGGQGKTTIALEYARRHKDSYSAVFFLDARNMNLLPQISTFAHDLVEDLRPYDGGKAEERLAYYLEEIAAYYRGNILLIIDDVPSSGEVKSGYKKAEGQLDKFIKSIPEVLRKRYRLLITSRHELLRGKLEKYMIEKMNHDDAVALFISRSNWETLSTDDPKLSKLVDNLLGGHPLSIALVGAYSREHQVHDPDRLISIVETRLVEAEALNDIRLAEYPLSLHASFMISFEAINEAARLLLLSLSMFRRSTVAVQSIRKCAKFMSPQTPEMEALQKSLNKKGPSKLFRELINHSLAEQVIVDDQKNKSEIIQVQLHEVIYDFTQSHWVILLENEQYHNRIRDLETSFIQGACRYASQAIHGESIEFRDIETLTGLLIPIAKPDRNYIPSKIRTATALDFWFHHFRFQNFVYDTGIQELLLDQMLQLQEYLASKDQLSPMFKLILYKLIGHAYYAEPKATGEIAKQYFDQALECARQLLNSPDADTYDSTIRWYIIFLLDHRSNVASKNRPVDQQDKPICNDQNFTGDFSEIENALPSPLRELIEPPEEPQCELLLRAAHYWGHRGNQDSYSLYRKYLTGIVDNDWGELLLSSTENYTKALNYRLLGLKTFMPGEFNRYLVKMHRNNQLPFSVPWLDKANEASRLPDYESFTSVAQGIGDAAHQYRGLHFVFVLEYLVAKKQGNPTDFLKVENAFQAAVELWKIASQCVGKGEVLLKYYLWMSSSSILMRWVAALENNEPLPTLQSSLELLEKETKRLQETMKSGYQ
ncbi:MAG: NB-ARC domain-containing protein, partial [Pseudomonadales bacterium]|nr:NB-ARC domain-containing protein [Pseudomonadales bacterium]